MACRLFNAIQLTKPTLNFGNWTNKIWIKIQKLSFKKLHLKMCSAKWRRFCLGLYELSKTDYHTEIDYPGRKWLPSVTVIRLSCNWPGFLWQLKGNKLTLVLAMTPDLGNQSGRAHFWLGTALKRGELCLFVFGSMTNKPRSHLSPAIGMQKKICANVCWLVYPGQNGCHFADNIFRYIFVNEKICNLIRISLKFVPKGPIDNNPTLV